jgi:membrane protein YqaA with SNARE-associated domain
MLKKTYEWMGKQIHSKHATWFLALLFYLEAIFFFPTEPILILYGLERRNRVWYYATTATLASVVGGMTGYCIGFWVWHIWGEQIIQTPVVLFFIKPPQFYYLCSLFKDNEWWALLVAGFSFIPFKATTLAAGFCQLSPLAVFCCACVARGVRLFAIAGIIHYWGTSIKKYIDRSFTLVAWLALLIGALIVAIKLYY